MKKITMKRIISSIMAVAFAFTLAAYPLTNVSAAESIPPAPDDFGDPISVTTYVEEDGSIVTERIYFYSEAGSNLLRDTSGYGWYRNEKEHEWTSGSVTTYYAQGYFVWGNGDVSVSSPSGGASQVSGITLSNQSLTSGTGRYAFIFNKYAYVTYSFTTTTQYNRTANFSVTIRISQSGNNI